MHKKIKVGSIVQFKRVYKIDLADLVAKQNYSKFMVVVSMNHFPKVGKTACRVLCANGEINWVSMERIESV